MRPARLFLWLAAIATLGLAAGIGWYLAPLEPGVLALQFAFTPRSFGQIIHLWSPGQLARFRAHIPADYALLLSYGATGYLLATQTPLFRSVPAVRVAATWALVLAAAFDAVENGLHLWLTEVPRFGVQAPYLVAASCASLKWLLLLAYGFTAVIAVARTKD